MVGDLIAFPVEQAMTVGIAAYDTVSGKVRALAFYSGLLELISIT